MRQPLSAIAAVDIPGGNLLLRQTATGYVSLCGSNNTPFAVSTNAARRTHAAPCNALVDDVFALTAAAFISDGTSVELAEEGRVRPYVAGRMIGRALTTALTAGDWISVGVELAGFLPGGGGTGGIEEAPTDGRLYARQGDIADWVAIQPALAAPPGTAAPEGVIIGTAKGVMYTQLHSSGLYIARQWVFNGTVGTSTGWL